MRKRREKQEVLKPRIAEIDGKGEEEEEKDEERSKESASGFFSCYLLTSLCPRFKGHTYIGFTVNPKRRIRQHNGEIGCGAWRTKRKRPWEMVLCIYGFPTNVSALQFEWAWQHPNESLAVRKAAASFMSLSGIANKVKLAYTMLTLPAWCNLNITINYFSTKYMKNAAGCPSLPEQMKVVVYPFDELPCYSEGIHGAFENEDGSDHNEEFEETAGIQAYKSIQEDVSTEMSQKLMDSETSSDEVLDDLHGCDKELEDNEQKSPTTTSSSLLYCASETQVIIENRDMYKFEVSSTNLQQPVREDSAFGMTTTEISQLPTNNYGFPTEFEIIDLSTPSSDCRTISNRYKRRVPSVRSQIIDLTRSPTFIQL